MKRWRLGASALAVLATVGVCVLFLPALRQTARSAAALSSHPIRWVLDAGHGGEDGGAVSVTGVAESGINLDIVRRMDAVLGLWGQPACLLREEDISLHDPEAGTLREKKVSDLHNRAAAVEALEGATLVSIHQNSYPQSRYHGTQVFFAPTEGSQQLAEAIQQGVQGTLQLENRRAAKQIAGNVYLMNHVDNRAVLVECGFLSNPEEERALRDPEYQTRMAAVLAWVCLMDKGAVPS